MDSTVLLWEPSFYENLRFYLCILSLIFIATALLSDEMKRQTKVIVITVNVVLLLFLPFARRMEIQDYVEKQGYTLIVREDDVLANLTMDYRYIEAADPDCLKQRLLKGFVLEHEHKLILVYWTKSILPPMTLEEIGF